MEHESTYSNLKQQLSSFNVISFSLWDTLISRCVLHPHDMFSIVENRTGITGRRFVTDRIRAGQIADAQFGECATLVQIYKVLEESFMYPKAQARQLMEAELQTELEIAVPRVPMVRLLQELLQLDKRVVICCDTCLSSHHLRKLLDKCGIPATVELWLSCEKGAGKKSEAFWSQLLASVPSNLTFVHLGSDPDADLHPLNRLGRQVIRIQSGMDTFASSPMAPYLFPFFKEDIACSLFMGYFIHRACFNSPFSDGSADDAAIGIWMGAPLACFMDDLVSRRDDSLLLFVTREGYLLQPMYTRYCAALGINPQDNALFYASRSAALAAVAVSESSFQETLRFAYRGTIGHLMKTRFNFDLPRQAPLYDQEITLPEESGRTENLLKPYLTKIIANSQRQKEAYSQYIRHVNPDNKPMTVVDVGYSGTIQYALAKISSEMIGGHYMYLTEEELPSTIGCPVSCLHHTWRGNCPIFDNLLFLEAAMRAPFGQLQQMHLEKGQLSPVFSQDANVSEHLLAAQEQYIRFVEWAAGWKRILGDAFQPSFSLAEAIWISMLKFECLPKPLLDSFWLTDDFAGTPLWRYDPDTHTWIGRNKSVPLTFLLQKAGTRLSWKQRMKNCVKRYIPRPLYACARKIWNRYLR